MPNGSLQDYQAGHSAICHGPLPHFGPIPVHSMQAPAMLNHIQMPGPQRHSNTVHGVNASGIGLTLDPRLAFLYNSGHATGPQIHGFLSNQVNNGSLRMLPYEVTSHSQCIFLLKWSHTCSSNCIINAEKYTFVGYFVSVYVVFLGNH
jgi:hypothetical protein